MSAQCVFSQTLKYSSKSHPGSDHRHEKMRDPADATPPCKILRRSDSPDNKHTDNSSHGRAKAMHTHRGRERDGGKNGQTPIRNTSEYLLSDRNT